MIKQNVTTLVTNKSSKIPTGKLMSFRELSLKHGFDYNYLYKISILEQKVTPYFRGIWKLDENELLNYMDTICTEKLSKIKKQEGE